MNYQNTSSGVDCEGFVRPDPWHGSSAWLSPRRATCSARSAEFVGRIDDFRRRCSEARIGAQRRCIEARIDGLGGCRNDAVNLPHPAITTRPDRASQGPESSDSSFISAARSGDETALEAPSSTPQRGTETALAAATSRPVRGASPTPPVQQNGTPCFLIMNHMER